VATFFWSMLKTTFPVGTTEPVAGVTEAVKVRGVPVIEGF